MAEQSLRVAVVGAGGMGALFGAILHEGGLAVTLFDVNSEHVAAIKNDGLRIEGFGGGRTVAVAATDNSDDLGQADVFLFQCKGHATRDAARSIKHLIDNDAVAISFQNGLGNEEALAQELGSDRVLGGVTAMASLLLSPGNVRDFSRVPSYVGEMTGGVSERVERIAATLTSAGLETHASSNITYDIWKKLLGNIAMSAVSGVTDMTSVEALRIPDLRETCFRALDEALAVAEAHNVDLDRDEAVRGLEMITAAGGTGDNKSSLCVDILNRRPTEVDFIYGSIIAKGREAGVATPTLATLASLVKGLESRYVTEGAIA